MAELLAFGGWLKQRRRALDRTQEALAEQCACSVETIRKLEAGTRRHPPLHQRACATGARTT